MHLTCRACGGRFVIKSRGWMDQWLPRACCGPCFHDLMLEEGRESPNEVYVDGKRIVPFVPSDLDDRGPRSSFESTFNALLTSFNIGAMHEPLKFFLSNGEAYVPDYLLWPAHFGRGAHGPFVEVKGQWTTEGKRKFKLFTKDYPDLHIFLVDEKMLSVIKRGKAP